MEKSGRRERKLLFFSFLVLGRRRRGMDGVEKEKDDFVVGFLFYFIFGFRVLFVYALYSFLINPNNKERNCVSCSCSCSVSFTLFYI